MDELGAFWRAIQVIEAQKALVAMDVAAFPVLTNERDRMALRENYVKQARFGDEAKDDMRPRTTEELAALFGGVPKHGRR
jgi:hypothetical protein